MIPKINIGKQMTWEHHRSGWQYVISCLKSLHNSNGIRFEGWADGFFSYNNELIKEPWAGFLHNTPSHPEDTDEKYIRMKSLSRILESRTWHESLRYCKGIFVLSKYVEKFIKSKSKSKLCISSVVHPVEKTNNTFDINKFINNKEKKLIALGHWLRKFDNFYNIKTQFKKILLKIKEAHNVLTKMENTYVNHDVTTMLHVPNDYFDNLFCENIVFLELYDVSACNTILDCLIRNTPILTNRLPASEEYLGKDYPFFFSTLEEATEKLTNLNLIKDSTNYLKDLDKTKFTKDFFLKSMVESEVYKNIKICLL